MSIEIDAYENIIRALVLRLGGNVTLSMGEMAKAVGYTLAISDPNDRGMLLLVRPAGERN